MKRIIAPEKNYWVNDNILVPEKLIFIKRGDGTSLLNVTYIFPNGKLCIRDRYYYNKILGRDEVIDRNTKFLEKGIVPEEWKDKVWIVNNSPFKPEVFYDEKHLLVNDKERNISFYSEGRKIFTRAVFELGFDGKNYINDCIIGFKYDEYYADNDKDFPTSLTLIQNHPLRYEHLKHFYQRSQKFYSNSKLTSSLIPGHIYKLKGFEEMKIDNKEISQEILRYSKYVIYIGRLKFANGNFHSPNFTPGTNYKTHDVFLRYIPGNLSLYSNLTYIERIDLEKILCDVTDISPDLRPTPKEFIEDIVDRFEKSIWSHKFWNTPGLVGKFITKNLWNSCFNYEAFRSRFCDNGCRLYEEVPIGGNKEVKALKSKCCNHWGVYSNIGYNLKNNDDFILRYFDPITLDCSDKSLPLQITHSILKPKKSEELYNWVGGKERCLEWCGSNEETLGYETSDGKYRFYELRHFLLNIKKNMWKSMDSSDIYFIADRI